MSDKFKHWIKEIDKDSLYIDHIKDQLTGWEINRLLEYLNQVIIKKMIEINSVLTANPSLKYGQDFTDSDLEIFKKVKIIVEEWKLKQGKLNFTPSKEPKLRYNQIALICIYNGIEVTKHNAEIIAKKHGWIAETSGKKLMQNYYKYLKPVDRKGIPKDPSQTKIKNKIALLESVLYYLEKEGLERAKQEISILKKTTSEE